MDKKKLVIIFSIVGVILIGVIIAFIWLRKPPPPPPVTLEFWSVFDNTSVYQPIIRDFQNQYPFVTVNYHKKDITTYEKELIDALAAGRGPDIFSINNTWLPKDGDKLSPAPTDLISPKKISDTFVDVVSQDFVWKGYVYALPQSVDTLALFYNKDLFNSAGLATPPATWSEFNADVEKLTRRDEQQNILQAGAALGTSQNVNRSTDILAALMLQSGAKMVSSDFKTATFQETSRLASGQSFSPGERALTFYTNFASPLTAAKNMNSVYTWNQYQHYSVDAFVEGKVAMMISYSYQIPVLRSRAPHLNFGIAPLPQISQGQNSLTLANYWGQAVSKTSPNATYAWQFLSFLVSQETLKGYLTATQKPTARRDLIDWQKGDADLGVFAEQSLTAKSWWEVDNAAVETIFGQMIDSVAKYHMSPATALQNASQQITVLMQKYWLDRQQ